MKMKATVTVFLFLSLFGFNTSFYRGHFYVNSPMNWTDAQQYCRNNNSDLSTASYEELQVLSANPSITSNYWVGLYRDADDPYLWRWTGGEEATNVIWAAGQQNNVNEKCGAVKKTSSEVLDSDCNDPFPFYCMRYELILVKNKSTWEEALLYCRQNYTDLARLSSNELMKVARNKTRQALTDDVWIGLRYLAGHWFWVNGKVLRQKFWSDDIELQCPAMDQRCGVYNRTQHAWKPTDCERRLDFLCLNKP